MFYEMNRCLPILMHNDADALMKKEIVTFDEKDEPTLLDPLFEYWVRKYFFEMQ